MGERQHLVMVPGLICDDAIWANQRAHLADITETSVAAVTEPATMAGMAEEVLAMAPPQFAIAGFSMGGYVALEVLRRAPDRVTRVAVLDCGAYADTPEKAAWRTREAERCEAGDFDAVVADMIKVLLHPDRQAGELADFVRAMAHRVGPAAFARRHRAMVTRTAPIDILPDATVSVRVICGREDAMNSPAEHAAMAAAAPHGRCSIVEDCGHMPPIERPQAASALLRDWLIYD